MAMKACLRVPSMACIYDRGWIEARADVCAVLLVVEVLARIYSPGRGARKSPKLTGEKWRRCAEGHSHTSVLEKIRKFLATGEKNETNGIGLCSRTRDIDLELMLTNGRDQPHRYGS
jgi:hypothetical protein